MGGAGQHGQLRGRDQVEHDPGVGDGREVRVPLDDEHRAGDAGELLVGPTLEVLVHPAQ